MAAAREQANTYMDGALTLTMAGKEVLAIDKEAIAEQVKVADDLTVSFDATPLVSMVQEKVNAMEVQVELEEKLSAPVEEGQQVGRMVVTSGGEVLTELPLVADRAVARLTYWQILEHCLQTAFMGG